MKKVIYLIALAVVVSACSVGKYENSYISGDNKYYDNAASESEPMAPPVGDDMAPEGGGTDGFEAFSENPFVKTADEPSSSFSVDADGAAYAYMRRCLMEAQLPDRNSVRLEEYLNYFTFDYPEPEGEETLSINAEMGTCPWNAGHQLLRLGLKGKSLSEEEIPAANYIFLIDVSGSMLGADRMTLVKNGLSTMVDYLRPEDRVAIITYSGHVEKLVESTLISEGRDAIRKAIRTLNASGSTAGGEAMKMAYEEASAHYVEGGNNRIIMCTDGDFNVGVSSTEALVEMVESYQEKGIYLSIMGFGRGNYQDSRMENLSNHGNGTYTYIDSEEEMIKVFVNERSHFYSVANDTKCQVRFNPEVVESYRLLGYENRVMSAEEFEDSKKDAGEIGAGQTVTALYELVIPDVANVAPQDGESPVVATFEARYKKSLKDTESRSLKEDVYLDNSESENFFFAAGVAAYGLVLRDSEYKGDANLPLARELVQSSLNYDPDGYRAALLGLIDRAAALKY